MKNTEIYESIKKIIKDEIEPDFDYEINDDTNIIEDCNLNSIMILELMVELELLYSIEFDEDEFNIDLLSKAIKIADLINKKLRENENK